MADDKFIFSSSDFKKENRVALEEFFSKNSELLPKGEKIGMNFNLDKNGKVILDIFSYDEKPDIMEKARKTFKEKYNIEFGAPVKNGRADTYYSIRIKITEQQFYKLLEDINKKEGKELADKIKPELEKNIKERMEEKSNSLITPSITTKAVDLAVAKYGAPSSQINPNKEGGLVANISQISGIDIGTGRT